MYDVDILPYHSLPPLILHQGMMMLVLPPATGSLLVSPFYATHRQDVPGSEDSAGAA
jgi:hypothetical protein